MKDDLKRNLIDIIENNRLEAHNSEIDPDDFEAIKSDLEKDKRYIKGPGLKISKYSTEL